MSQEKLAERVGKRAGRTYSQSAAKGWLKGVVPSDLESQLALALELGADPGWLYFYPYSKAPAPPGADIAAAPATVELETIEEASLPVAKPAGRRKGARKKKGVQGLRPR